MCERRVELPARAHHARHCTHGSHQNGNHQRREGGIMEVGAIIEACEESGLVYHWGQRVKMVHKVLYQEVEDLLRAKGIQSTS